MKRVLSVATSLALVVGMTPSPAWAEVAQQDPAPVEQAASEGDAQEETAEGLAGGEATVEQQDADASTASGTCGESVYWELDEATKTLTLSGTGDMYDFTSDSAPWYSLASSIEHVVISDGVSHIGSNAFAGCSALTYVSLPASVRSIGDRAFSGIAWQGSAIDVPNWSVYDLFSPNNNYNPNTNLRIHGQNTDYLGRCGDVYWCVDDSGETLTIFGQGGMEGTASNYPWSLFKDSIKHIEVQQGVSSLGILAFSGFTELVSADIAGTVSSLSYPRQVQMMLSPFSNCPKLSQFAVSGTGSLTTDGRSLILDGDKIIAYASDSGTSYAIPSNVETIAGNTFSSSSTLQELTVPAGFTGVPDGRPGLDPWNLAPGSTIVAKSQAAADALSRDCSYPNSTLIVHETSGGKCGESVYWEFDEATRTLTISGTGAMDNWSGNQMPWYHFDPELGYEATVEHVVIEEGVTTIGSCAFIQHRALKDISLPQSLETVGREAFEFCTSLESISIPNSVQNIEHMAFSYCSSLKSVNIPQGMTVINQGTFSNCSSLESVTIPEGISWIRDAAFHMCTSLANVEILNPSLGNGEIPESVSGIARGAFTNIAPNSAIRVPNEAVASLFVDYDTNTTSGNYNGSLTTVRLPDPSGTCGENLTWTFDPYTGTLTISGEGAMEDFVLGQTPWNEYADQITTIVIEEGVTSIGANAFCNYPHVDVVDIRSEIIDFIGPNAFVFETIEEEVWVYVRDVIYCKVPFLDGVNYDSERVSIVSQDGSYVQVAYTGSPQIVEAPSCISYGKQKMMRADGSGYAMLPINTEFLEHAWGQAYPVRGSQVRACATCSTTETVSAGATVYRLYNPTTSEHLFTTDAGEYDSLTNHGWVQEGESWESPSWSAVPVYRLYNPALGAMVKMSHHYTADKEEADSLVANHGWKYDFDGDPVFYSSAAWSGFEQAPANGADPVYRLYNDGLSAHHFTLDKDEYDNLTTNHGWLGEGKSFYAFAPEE